MATEGKLRGAAVDYLVDYIAPEMEESIELAGPIPFSRLMMEFGEGKFDAILLLAATPERAKVSQYPRRPFGFMESALLVERGFPVETLQAPQDIAGLLIGYAQDAWITPFLRDKSVHFSFVSSFYATEINFRKFNEARISAVYNPDRIALLYRLSHFGRLREHRLVRVPGKPEGFYTVFSPNVPKYVISQYEKALEKVRQTTPYSQIVQKYMNL
jgi:hypothetical protein